MNASLYATDLVLVLDSKPFKYRGDSETEIKKDWFEMDHISFLTKWYETITGIPFYYPDFPWEDNELALDINLYGWQYSRGRTHQLTYNAHGDVTSAEVLY